MLSDMLRSVKTFFFWYVLCTGKKKYSHGEEGQNLQPKVTSGKMLHWFSG